MPNPDPNIPEAIDQLESLTRVAPMMFDPRATPPTRNWVRSMPSSCSPGRPEARQRFGALMAMLTAFIACTDRWSTPLATASPAPSSPRTSSSSSVTGSLQQATIQRIEHQFNRCYRGVVGELRSCRWFRSCCLRRRSLVTGLRFPVSASHPVDSRRPSPSSLRRSDVHRDTDQCRRPRKLADYQRRQKQDHSYSAVA